MGFREHQVILGWFGGGSMVLMCFDVSIGFRRFSLVVKLKRSGLWDLEKIR